jgi:hypothetical protein
MKKLMVKLFVIGVVVAGFANSALAFGSGGPW